MQPPASTRWSPHLKLTGLVDISDTNAISLNFENVNIQILIRYLGELTGETIIATPGLRGTVTIVNPKPLTDAEAVKVILSALELNGFTIIRQEHASKIVRSQTARSRSLPLYTHPVDDSDDTIRAQVVSLDHIPPGRAEELIAPFLTPGSGDVLVNDAADMIIIIDTGSNIKHIMDLVALIDIPVKQEEGDIKILPLRNAVPREIARLLTEILNAPAFRDPRFYRRSGRPHYATTFIPVPHRNALVVICRSKDWPMIEKLVRQLDVPSEPLELPDDVTRIYHLSNAPADTVAETLQQTYPGKLTAVGYKPGNAVVVHAPRDMHGMLAVLMKKLDIPFNTAGIDIRIVGLTACTVIFFIMCIFLLLFRRRAATPATAS
jgi:general secretion pathway protein D